MGSYLGNGITNVRFEMLNCLWFVDITIFFKGAPQKIVQQRQILSFMYFYKCMGPYLGDCVTNIRFEMLNCLWFVGITIFFKGAPTVSNPSFLTAN